MVETAGYYNGQRDNVVPFIPPQRSRVLEVGCGEGHFRTHLPASVEYWGVEANPTAAIAARARLTRVLACPLQDAWNELPDGHFDLVVCNDVIEHLTDHDSFLRDVQRKMSPGGRLMGSIPNVRYVVNLYELLLQKDWRYKDDGILDRTHLRFFTERSLRRSLAEHGFVIEAFGGIDPATVRGLSAKRLAVAGFRLLLGDDVRFRQFAFCAVRNTAAN